MRWLSTCPFLGLLLIIYSLSLSNLEAQMLPDTNDGVDGAQAFGYSGRVAGDTVISAGGALHLPLFNMDVSKDSNSFIRNSNLVIGLGIEGSLGYFLSDTFFLGGGLSVRGIGDRSKQVLWMFSLDLLAGFELPIYTSFSALNPLFVVPLSLRLSFAINRYTIITTFNPVIRPSVGLFWVLPNAANWAVGASLDYWLMFDLPGGANNRIGNYLQVFLGFRYYTY